MVTGNKTLMALYTSTAFACWFLHTEMTTFFHIMATELQTICEAKQQQMASRFFTGPLSQEQLPSLWPYTRQLFPFTSL